MIRVLVVNNMRLISSVITTVLMDEPDIQVVGRTTSVEEAIAHAPECDVLLVTTQLQDNGALRITRAIAQTGMPAKVLIIGLAESKREILQYAEAGAAGYVLQNESVHDLLIKIRASYHDQALISPEVAAALLSRVSELAQASPTTDDLGNAEELTPRETEILELIGKGLSNREVADHLVLEVGTVKNHVHSILQKLNVSNRHEAIRHLPAHE